VIPQWWPTPVTVLRDVMPARGHEVVVVEDDAGMRRAIERLLRGAGFRPLLFPSAEALLEAGAGASTVCFVLDIHLPGLSGFELRERLSRGDRDLPTVFITAYDDPAARERAHDAGALAYLTKPFPGRSLLEAVSHALEKTHP
jgi:FixJ family two-component response regulator